MTLGMGCRMASEEIVSWVLTIMENRQRDCQRMRIRFDGMLPLVSVESMEVQENAILPLIHVCQHRSSALLVLHLLAREL